MAIEYLESAFSFEHDIPSPFESLSFSETLLWLLTFASTGYTQGFFPVSVIGKVLAMIIPILGIGTALSAIIAFAHSRIQIKDHEKRGLRIKTLKNHVILCGWNERAPGIIRGLTNPNSEYQFKVIVLAEIDGDYPLSRYNFRPHMVHYYRGISSSKINLEMVGVTSAHSLIVLDGNKKISNRNARSVLAVLTANRLLKDHRENLRRQVRSRVKTKIIWVFRIFQTQNEQSNNSNSSTNAYAELLFKDDLKYFRYAGVNKLVILETIRERFVAAACMSEGVTDLLLGFLNYGDRKMNLFRNTKNISQSTEITEFTEPNNLFSIRIGDLPKRLRKEICSKNFEQILLTLRSHGALLIAIHQASSSDSDIDETVFRDDSPYIIRPNHKERSIETDLNDRIIYISTNKILRKQ